MQILMILDSKNCIKKFWLAPCNLIIKKGIRIYHTAALGKC
jgi:hypothetical protein